MLDKISATQKFDEHPEQEWRLIGIYSENRPEYALLEIACLSDSIAVVPIPVRSAEETSISVITI